jgi:CheY-like chemotaxis protein
MNKPKVILIEQDQSLGDMYIKQLSQRFKVVHLRNAQSAIEELDREGADIIVTDILLSSNNGIEVVHELRSYDDWSQIPIVVLSSLPAYSFPGAENLWARYKVSHFLFKPRTSPKSLMQTISLALS